MLKEIYKDIIKEELGYLGMMISGSKSGYRSRHPNHIVAFNANIIFLNEETRDFQKVWWGDFDLSLSRDNLKRLAKATGHTVILLNEMWGRFEFEEEPQIKHYIYSVSSIGEESLGEWYKEMVKLKEDGLFLPEKI